MVSDLLRGFCKQQSAGRGFHRRIRIIILPRTFENIAAIDLLSTEISRLAGYAAQLVELVEPGLQLVVTDGPVLDGHIGRNGFGAVFLRDFAFDAEIGWQKAPMQSAPMIGGAA